MEKTTIHDLAILGGTPLFSAPAHVGAPNIGNRARLMARIEDALDRRWLTNNGRYVQEFEARVADMAGVKHCVATCNGTVALEIAIRALGLSGEVIVPSFTFVATAHALQWQEITPVFADIDPQTFNVDPKSVEQRITPDTTGIIGVHLWGRPCDTQRLAEIATAHRLRLMFDASHAFGCTHSGQRIGSFGDAEVFSFHATKFVNALEGGAICTNNESLAAICRRMKNFGFVHYDEVVHVGTNGKLDEFSAAMGLTSLESIETFIATNHRNYHEYQRQLAGTRGLQLVSYNETEAGNYQYVVVEVDVAQTGISRDLLFRLLHEEKILARRYFTPGCHRMEPYRTLYPSAGRQLPHTEFAAARMIALPTGTAVGVPEIQQIAGLLKFVMEHGEEISRATSSGAKISPPHFNLATPIVAGAPTEPPSVPKTAGIHSS